MQEVVIKLSDGKSLDDAELYEAIGEALRDANKAAAKGDTKEAGRLFCMAADLERSKGEY